MEQKPLLGRLYKNEGRGYQYVVPTDVYEHKTPIPSGLSTVVKYYDIKYPESVGILLIKDFNISFSLVER